MFSHVTFTFGFGHVQERCGIIAELARCNFNHDKLLHLCCIGFFRLLETSERADSGWKVESSENILLTCLLPSQTVTSLGTHHSKESRPACVLGNPYSDLTLNFDLSLLQLRFRYISFLSSLDGSFGECCGWIDGLH